MKRLKEYLIEYCPMSVKDWLICLSAMTFGAVVCILLKRITTTDTHVPIIFVLMVLVTALLTNGYFYGILASLASVFAVNWAFTFPYMKVDFSLIGYPLTFFTMLAVSIAASMLATGTKQAEKLKREREAEKMRANLLRSVSHDLRTPLTAIGGSISAVLENEHMDGDTKRKLLENARQDAEWLYRMVENLLSVTQISGSAQLHKVDELVEEVIGEAVVNFRKKNPDIAVEVSLSEDPVFVPMDAMLIEQVIRNLLDNAVIHGETTDHIRITIREYDGFVRISIRDNGKGIRQNILPHLFDGTLEPGGELTDNNRFMGIGLAVCRTIVKAHGGDIFAENEKSGGAVFSFTLPKGENRDDGQG